MKAEYESARFNYSLHKSTNIMLDKSKRKYQDTHRANAQNVNNDRTNSHDNVGEYLADYAYHTIWNELSLSRRCRVMKYDNETFFCLYSG